jgi:hypothetical protein
MTIDQIIVQLQAFLDSADSAAVEPAEAEAQLDACYASLNAKTLFKQGNLAPNMNMDFAQARDEIEMAVVAHRQTDVAHAVMHAKEALAFIRGYGSTVL